MTRGHAGIRAALLASALVATLSSCAEARPLTQLIVVVDTDLPIGIQLDSVRLDVDPPGGDPQTRLAALTSANELPITLGLVHRGGALEPIAIEAVGSLGGTERVRRRVVTGFLEGRTLVVEIFLSAACIDVACEGDTTCVEGACVSPVVPANTLRDWDGGALDRADGGVRGDGCISFPEACNDADDDCDGFVDEAFDLASDPMHCGACGNACPAHPQAMPACVARACGMRCATGYGDCDGDPRNGCEVELNSLAMCGACGVECSADHATPTCFTSECTIDLCAPGWGDCNDDAADGCETPLVGIAHCGACGSPCAPSHATGSCSGGTCRVSACEPGWADCNGLVADGCEVALGTTTDCTACGDACGAVDRGAPGCTPAGCGIAACDPGRGDCNAMASDGCETPLDTLSSCGACGTTCALAHGSETCASGSCAIVACDPGWADCDGIASNGCEASLETASDCGGCGVACAGATPVCSESAGGGRACRAACDPGLSLCGAACVDTAGSLDHCGGCGRACAPANAVAACSGGACAIAACDPGWADCDGSVGNGCETSLRTLSDCGACGVACALSYASETCAMGACAIVSCEPGRANCDGMAANGCERSISTLSDCGACGVACALANASESCATGVCVLAACEAGFADCNSVPSDGCETMLGTLTDCGGCGVSCDVPRATESCAGGTCALGTCDAGWGDCNGVVADGCERSLRTASDCGGCGMACPDLPRATESCATGTCGVGTCDPGWGDCNGMASDGCERSLTTMSDCGGCGIACPTPGGTTTSCASGTCAITRCSSPDRADCDGIVSNGCETRIDRDEANCGACGTRCGPGQTCESGRCRS